MVNLVLIDDHTLFRNALTRLVQSIGYNVLFEADNGKDFIRKMGSDILPDVVLLDINMPQMDGYDTAQWIKANYPEIKILTLSMYDNERSILCMLRSGAKGYILKNCEPEELNDAIQSLLKKGYYSSDLVSAKLIAAINTIHEDPIDIKKLLMLNEREVDFLKHICSELTYKEIADKMGVTPRTVDSYRDGLFDKLNIKTRTGLVLYAIRNSIVNLL